MQKINLPQASGLTSPNPVTLVCTEKPDGATNLATVSWWTYLSFNPSMIAYAMAKTSYSGEMVRNNKKVILTIPGAAIAEAVMGCGSTTGRNTDKANEFGIELVNVEDSTIQIPAHSRVAIVCSGIPRGWRPLSLYLRCGAGLRKRGRGSSVCVEWIWKGFHG